MSTTQSYAVIAAHPFTLRSGRPVSFGDTADLEPDEARELIARGHVASDEPPEEPAAKPRRRRDTTPTTPTAEPVADDGSQEATS